MKQQKKGGAVLTSLLSIALMCSVMLNVVLISGCRLVDGLAGVRHNSEPPPQPTEDVRLGCMREAADAIGVAYKPGATAAEILADIRITARPVSFNGKVLTEKEIKAASSMLDPAAVSTLRENQKFLDSVKGKKLYMISPIR